MASHCWNPIISLTSQASLGNDNFLQAAMNASSERLAIVKKMGIGPSHYQFKYDQLRERLQWMSEQLERPGGKIQVNLSNQVNFFLPPPNYVHRPLSTTSRYMNPLTQQFLGDYEALFDGDIEQPIPSLKALEWILEDVG